MSLLIQSRMLAGSSSKRHVTLCRHTIQPQVMDIGTVTDDVYAFHDSSPLPVTGSYYCGLPYQDHNYGAPPPFSPPRTPPSPPHTPTIEITPPSTTITPQKLPTPITTPVSDEKKDKKNADIILVTKYNPPLPDPEAQDDSVTRCICEYTHDDGYMICCDSCSVWQHIDCWGIDRNAIPDMFFCELCQPRPFDKIRARTLQAEKREHLSDSSSSDSETPGQYTVKKVKMKKRTKQKVLAKTEKRKELMKTKRNRRHKFMKLNNSATTKHRIKLHKKTAVQRVLNIQPIKLRNTNNSALIHLFCEDNHDVWRDSQSLAAKNELNTNNTFSTDLQTMLATRKINGFYHNIGGASIDSCLCHLNSVDADRKGLESLDDIGSNEELIEYTGTVMLRDQFDKDNATFYTSSRPFVLFTKLDDIEVCIDATNSTNIARYIRRSCSPNAEVRQLISHDGVHFLVVSTRLIPKGIEITIPFDFKISECQFTVECACGTTNCSVAKIQKRKRRPSGINLNRSPVKPRLKKQEISEKKTAKKEEPNVDIEETSAAEAVECAEADTENHVSDATAIALSPTKSAERTNQVDLLLNAAAYLQEKEIKQEVTPPESSRKMTREEKKIEAYMKAFENMERKAERRKSTTSKKKGEIDSTVKCESNLKDENAVDVDGESPVVESSDPPQPEPATDDVTAVPPKDVVNVTPTTFRKRRKSQAGKRRTTRANTHSEAVSTTDDSTGCNVTTSMSPKSRSTPSTPVVSHTDLSPPLSAQPQPASTKEESQVKIKTKRHLMNEWLSERNHRCDPLEVTVDDKLFVTCLPSPRTLR